MAGKVLVLMGSKNDAEVMGETARVLSELGVPCTMTVASAHRSPARTQKLARDAAKDGYSVIVAGAGAAAHLAGTVAAETVLPVIGVPLAGSPLFGLDALLSTVQMPGGVPVATMAVGKAGAHNAAVLAAQILALSDPRLAEKLKARRREMADAVAAAAEKVR
ncbi:MAG: 5-(carboxyamino)imidazole ribonucleotide mutase [Gemmatimonadota bacterium]